jgi:hypothetical protein
MPSRKRPTSIAFAAILLAVSASAWTPSSAMAGAESDIPGIPLQGPVSTGELGGPIYDVVYRLDVQPGYVIVAALTGTAGTDFDLYLFNGTATSVVNNVGVVAKSTTSTSSEALAWASRLGGRYYLDLNGATDVQGTYRLTVQIVPDPSPPVVQVQLAGGRKATNDPAVAVTIVASDDLSGVSEVALSDDGVTYQPWIPYTGRASWLFPSGDGVKRLWVKVMNGVGLVSPPVVASIILDTVAPTVVSVTPTRDSVTTELRPVISVVFSKPLDPSTWQNYALVLQSSDGFLVGGTFAYYSATRTGTFVPSVELTPGAIYFATVGPAKDLAGNQVATTGSWWLKPLLATSLSVVPSAAIVTFGTPVTLTGIASTPVGEPLSIEARPARELDFTTITTATPSGGEYEVPLQPAINATYRVSYPGSAIAQASTSPTVRVLVRWWVVLSGRGPSIVRTGQAGKAITVQARIAPVSAGQAVSFQLYRFDAVRKAYVYAGSRGTKARADGTASISWTPSAGRWQWRATVPPSPFNANGMSRPYTWSISR